LYQLLNTAPIAPQSWSYGSSGEGLACLLLDDGLLAGDEIGQGLFVELGVGDLALELGGGEAGGVEAEVAGGLRAGGGEGGLEPVAGDLEDDAGVEEDEAALGVERELAVAGALGEALRDGVVEAEVEDGVHHAGHRRAGAGADGEEQGRRGVAEAGADDGGDAVEGGADLVFQGVGELAAGGEEVVAHGGGDREPGRHGDAEAGHLGEAGALSAEQLLLLAVAVRVPCAEEVDRLAHRADKLVKLRAGTQPRERWPADRGDRARGAGGGGGARAQASTGRPKGLHPAAWWRWAP
jgi:hypothetical protein